MNLKVYLGLMITLRHLAKCENTSEGNPIKFRSHDSHQKVTMKKSSQLKIKKKLFKETINYELE
jgi:hypothetical protein